MQDIFDTSAEKILRACEIGKKAGLKYVYAGNISGIDEENSYCPQCGELNIKRVGYDIQRLYKKGKCRKCGEDLNLVTK